MKKSYSQETEVAIQQDFDGWSGTDQKILDAVRNKKITPQNSLAKALWRWLRHRLVNHADGTSGDVADELTQLGVTAEEPPHYWPGT